ncbi:hypothetical protein WJX72_009988 [[Myrmecia] bisecta]|uniref:Protein kinase domain-containing protein n=1 Tax=[Myrmecia] bisecta TaxID=41462 RepID=A0AAW1R8R8_9CHLO
MSEPSLATGASGENALPVIDPVQNYEKIRRIGEGTYGTVYKARDRRTGEVVALKQLRMERERDGMPVTSMRELRVLQTCRHPSIVELKKVVTGSKLDSVFLVFEYCSHDLGRLVDTIPRKFSESEVKCLLLQILEAVDFMHARWIMHRDLKLSNLLLTKDSRLKICDFGLARYFRAHEEAYTPRVVTLWYRAPEILLGLETYTEAVDMWSVGCIMAELLRCEPLFPAKTEMQLLQMITALIGAPNERIWPGYSSLPLTSKMTLPDQPYNLLERELPHLSAEGTDLLNRFLTYDPDKRITARQALRHPYFRQNPFPRPRADMPQFPSAHDAELHSNQAHRRAQMEEQEADTRKKRRAQQDVDSRFGDVFGGDGGGAFGAAEPAVRAVRHRH